jgi:hypothetical protein
MYYSLEKYFLRENKVWGQIIPLTILNIFDLTRK